jgi:hypothetical protein
MSILHKLTELQINEICDLYTNSTKIIDICRRYGLYQHHLYSILRSRKIPNRGQKKISQELIQSIMLDVSNGESVVNARKKWGVPESTAAIHLRKNGFKCPHTNGNKKYTINESFFETIDSPEKSQILGILYADGSMSSVNKLMSLRLEKSDSDYLEGIKRLIGSNKPLYYIKGATFVSPSNNKTYKRRATACMDISNREIYADLIGIGLIPRKKLLNVAMPYVRPELEKYFILGYFEGDGWITWSRNAYCLGICGSKRMCEGIHSAIYNHLGIDGNVSPTSTIFKVSYQRIKDIVRIIEWLYDGKSSLRMDRKYRKCKRLLTIFGDKGYTVPDI